MKTVKEVAELTGISIRTLQYYDEIGVFKPTSVTEAGYRLYDEEALGTLQQILFYKELDFPLKDIKAIMENPNFDRTQAFKQQKALLTVKRDRLNRLLELLDKLEKGEMCMSFKEFDLSEYIGALEQFKLENPEEITKHWGSMEAFEQLINRVKDHEPSIAQSAIQYYGSVEKYTAAMKDNLSHFSENMAKMQNIKEKGYVERNQALIEQLTQDVTKDWSSPEIQEIVREMINLLAPEDQPVMDSGENHWNILIDSYLHNQAVIEAVDRRYGKGASEFMGKAYQYYFNKR